MVATFRDKGVRGDQFLLQITKKVAATEEESDRYVVVRRDLTKKVADVCILDQKRSDDGDSEVELFTDRKLDYEKMLGFKSSTRSSRSGSSRSSSSSSS